jgi:cellulose synthase/poly-beta-1,6-N-acetylglucosamine synthase-like glycosyltransferase
MNRNRWLTRWQALEYITSQNLEKRAFDLLNCIPVVPGAVGAWRAELLRANHGFSGDTVAEDTDLTLTIRRNGWKILYDEDAIGRTEVPERCKPSGSIATRSGNRATARWAGSPFPTL